MKGSTELERQAFHLPRHGNRQNNQEKAAAVTTDQVTPTPADAPPVDSVLFHARNNAQKLLELLGTGCEVHVTYEAKERTSNLSVYLLAKSVRSCITDCMQRTKVGTTAVVNASTT